MNTDNTFTSSQVRQFWDSVADIYDQANDNVRDAHDQRYRESFKYFPTPPPPCILNIWSRTGEAVEFLKEHNVHSNLINLEVSFAMIERARRHGRVSDYVQTDLVSLPIKSASIDLVWSLETLEHCPSPKSFLAEINRTLKVGGFLILSCPPAFAEIILRLYELVAFNHGEGPHRFLPSRTVKRLFAECGFELLDHRGTLFIPFKNRVLKKLDKLVEGPLNKVGLSDLGIRQFFCAKKIA